MSKLFICILNYQRKKQTNPLRRMSMVLQHFQIHFFSIAKSNPCHRQICRLKKTITPLQTSRHFFEGDCASTQVTTPPFQVFHFWKTCLFKRHNLKRNENVFPVVLVIDAIFAFVFLTHYFTNYIHKRKHVHSLCTVT